MSDKLQRQININLQLRRQLETARRDAVEYCAKFCEEHEVEREMGKWYLQESGTNNHEGTAYAKGLRGIIGNDV